MAFSSAVKLLAFASTAQANEVAKIPTDALAGEPAPSATTLQQRNLLGVWDVCSSYNDSSAGGPCCNHWQCPDNYECSYMPDPYYSSSSPYYSSSSHSRQCTYRGYSKGYGIAANDYGLALTGGMGFSTLSVTIGFLMDLPKKWTKGDYVQLTAILLQISSAIGTFISVNIIGHERLLVWISAIAYLLSEPILILGMKMKSFSHRPNPKARRVKLIGAGGGFFLTLLFGSARYVTVKRNENRGY